MQQIQISTVRSSKKVNKPWGWEIWIADGKPTFPYAFKELYIKSSCRTSLQFHKTKQETSYVQKGKGILHYSNLPIDAEKFIKGGYSSAEMEKFLGSIKTKELTVGSVFHVFPGLMHRLEAIEDLVIIESSTTELDDVIRLQDDSSRTHGRIEAEHRS